MESKSNLGIDPATAVYTAIQQSNNMHPAAFPPFLFWFGPAVPPDGYLRLGMELSGTHLHVKAMDGYESALMRNDGQPHPGYESIGVAVGELSSNGLVNRRYLVTIAPDGSTAPPADKIFLNPGLVDFPANMALEVGKCFLPVPNCPVVEPVFDPNYGDGQVTPSGVRRVAVLPKTSSSQGPSPVFGLTGDYLYLSNEANWVLQNTQSTPQGGTEAVSITVGVTQFDSDTFYKDTKIQTSVDVGVITKLFTVGYSVDMSDEMSLTVIHNETHSSEVTVNTTIQFPNSDLSQFWQGYSNIVLYASDGTIVSQVTNLTRDTRLTWQGEK